MGRRGWVGRGKEGRAHLLDPLVDGIAVSEHTRAAVGNSTRAPCALVGQQSVVQHHWLAEFQPEAIDDLLCLLLGDVLVVRRQHLVEAANGSRLPRQVKAAVEREDQLHRLHECVGLLGAQLRHSLGDLQEENV